MTAPLPLGRVLATPGALNVLGKGGGCAVGYLARHAMGDWGHLCAFDRRQNAVALRDSHRILSSYDTPAGCLWVITEADRSVTTVLLAEEY